MHILLFRRAFRPLVAALVFVSLLTVVPGCTDGDAVDILRPDASQLFWSLTNDSKAVTVNVGGTQQLVATPRYVSGDTVTGRGMPTYVSLDSTKVAVDANGVITGREETTGINVISSLTVDGLTHADTTTVAVTTVRHPLASFHLTDAGGFPLNTTIEINGSAFLGYAATDSSGAPVTELAVSYRVVDTLVLSMPYGFLQGKVLGKTKVIASTTSYGRTFEDTVEFKVLYATTGTVYTSGNTITGPMTFSPNATVIAVGGTVTWSNYFFGQMTASIIFDGGVDNILGGNITSLSYLASESRTFLAPGTYTYKNTLSGGTGTIFVRAQPEL